MSPVADARFPDVDRFLALGGRLRIIAHRGFSGVAPENTVSAFTKALEVGVDMIELDVLTSRDGEVVVIHDETLERTTNGSGRVIDHTYAKLRLLDAGSWFSSTFRGERIPNLSEVLELARGKTLLNVEIKSEAVTEQIESGIAQKVVGLVREARMIDRVLISSFEPRALEQLKRLEPRIRTVSLYNPEIHRGLTPAQIMSAVDSRGLNVARRYATETRVRQCHLSGRPIAVYTINDVQTMRELVDLGVDALFTDYPDLLQDLLAERHPM